MMLERYTTNAGRRTRMATLNGREYVVAPMVMLVVGVHNGSNGPLYYPSDELAKTQAAWNMRPVVVYHPAHGSATNPVELEARQVGMVMNARWDGRKLRAEAWLEADRLEQLAPEIAVALVEDQPVEVSTGLFTDNVYEPGVWNGKEYEYVARNHQPDHLALLPEGVGACNLSDGCGLLQLNEENTDMGHETAVTLPPLLFGNQDLLTTNRRGGWGDDDVLPLPTLNFGTPCGCQQEAPVHNGAHDENILPLPTMNFGEREEPTVNHGGDALPLPSTL